MLVLVELELLESDELLEEELDNETVTDVLLLLLDMLRELELEDEMLELELLDDSVESELLDDEVEVDVEVEVEVDVEYDAHTDADVELELLLLDELDELASEQPISTSSSLIIFSSR